MTAHDGPTQLYRYFDATGALLYIGVSRRWFRRNVDHQREASWHYRISSATIEMHPTRAAALDAERDAIRKERPLYNVVHNDAAERDPCRNKGGRPAVGRVTNVRLRPGQYDRIDALRQAAGVSRAEMIRRVLAVQLGAEGYLDAGDQSPGVI